jgi:hypothetical protein
VRTAASPTSAASAWCSRRTPTSTGDQSTLWQCAAAGSATRTPRAPLVELSSQASATDGCHARVHTHTHTRARITTNTHLRVLLSKSFAKRAIGAHRVALVRIAGTIRRVLGHAAITCVQRDKQFEHALVAPSRARTHASRTASTPHSRALTCHVQTSSPTIPVTYALTRTRANLGPGRARGRDERVATLEQQQAIGERRHPPTRRRVIVLCM